MTRFDNFLDHDDHARDEAAKFSSLVGIAVFLCARLLLKITGQTLGWLTIVAVALGYGYRVWCYCRRSQVVYEPHHQPFLVPRRLAMGTTSAAILAFFVADPPAVVEAAIIDRRLLALTRNPPLSPDQAERLSNNLRTATLGPVPLPTKTLIAVREVIVKSPPAPATASAANSLMQYGREIRASSRIRPNQEALSAYENGLSIYTQAYKEALSSGHNIDVSRASAAIEALSRSINLSRSDRLLRIEVLLARAQVYSVLGRANEALTDLKTAEDLGALDLASIISIAAYSLFKRRAPGDLERIIQLESLGLQLQPPQRVLSLNPLMGSLYRVQQYEIRALAYYYLGVPASAIEDASQALSLARGMSSGITSTLFYLIILAYLKQGQITEAANSTSEWLDRTGNPNAQLVRRVLESNRSDPQQALDEILEMGGPPGR